jgi:hypothetical protein
MKYQRYEVIFRTWNTKCAVVLATDEDDAISTAASQISLDEGEDYEVSDIFIINNGDGDYE